VGAATYVVLAATRQPHIPPNWTTGVVAGAGGRIDGYLGALLEPVPERARRATRPRRRHQGLLHHPGMEL